MGGGEGRSLKDARLLPVDSDLRWKQTNPPRKALVFLAPYWKAMDMHAPQIASLSPSLITIALKDAAFSSHCTIPGYGHPKEDEINSSEVKGY